MGHLRGWEVSLAAMEKARVSDPSAQCTLRPTCSFPEFIGGRDPGSSEATAEVNGAEQK